MATVPSKFGAGKFGTGKFSQGALAAPGRPYGIGAYGVGRYGVGAGANFEVAATTQIAFAVTAIPAQIFVVAGVTAIQLQTQASAVRIWSPAAATQIRFSTKWLAPQRVRTAYGRVQISFSVYGEAVTTWLALAPCEQGTWTQEKPPWIERMAA